MTTAILKHSDAIKFIFAGNATVTILNTKTGNRFTYNIKKLKTSTDENPLFFVKVLTGPEVYSFIGSMNKDKNYKHSQKSKINSEAQSVKVFKYVLTKLTEDKLDECVEIWHEGKCGRCGRQLTVPESIETGLGPECIKMISSTSEIRNRKIDNILRGGKQVSESEKMAK
jgi:hypothetical protein